MPNYDYLCQGCGHKFEQFQSIVAKSLRKCPQCGKFALKRLIGAGAGIIFKGSGFYQTDYRSDNYKAGHKTNTAAPVVDKSKTESAPKTTESSPVGTTTAEPKGKKKSS